MDSERQRQAFSGKHGVMIWAQRGSISIGSTESIRVKDGVFSSFYIPG